jgi:hypothetical protein
LRERVEEIDPHDLRRPADMFGEKAVGSSRAPTIKATDAGLQNRLKAPLPGGKQGGADLRMITRDRDHGATTLNAEFRVYPNR